MKIEKELLIRMLKTAYCAGIYDGENDCGQWCEQGSTERAEEFIQEYIDSDELPENFLK